MWLQHDRLVPITPIAEPERQIPPTAKDFGHAADSFGVRRSKETESGNPRQGGRNGAR